MQVKLILTFALLNSIYATIQHIMKIKIIAIFYILCFSYNVFQIQCIFYNTFQFELDTFQLLCSQTWLVATLSQT